MLSFADLESSARTVFEAESSARWESQDFLDAANEGLDDLSETGFYERFATIPLKGRQTYYDLRGFLPEDLVRLTFVFNPDNQLWLDPMAIVDMVTPRWETIPGTPQQYLVRGLYWLGLYPRPESDTGSVRVYYEGLAPHFKDSSSIISDLPDDLTMVLEDYILYDLSARDGESDKAMLHWSDYWKGRKDLNGFVKNRIESRAGRMSRR